MRAAPKPCGTAPGYRRHYRAGEPACRPCLDAINAYEKTRRKLKPRQLKPCGTYAAWLRHLNRRERPCDACVAAYRVYRAVLRAAKRGAT